MKKRVFKFLAVFLAVNMLYQIGFPVMAYALTSGPGQPEFSSFEPVNTTDMVDPFTGDFNYNIPLFDIEGYPVNISYHSGISMDQEASWCGLGWNINPGVINRNMRGLPDDFDGDKVEKQFEIKDNVTDGINLGAAGEIFGVDGLKLGANLGLTFNNYRGFGMDFSLSPSYNVSLGNQPAECIGLNLGLSLSFSSTDGVGFNPTASFSYKCKYETEEGWSGYGNSLGLGLSVFSGKPNRKLL